MLCHAILCHAVPRNAVLCQDTVPCFGCYYTQAEGCHRHSGNRAHSPSGGAVAPAHAWALTTQGMIDLASVSSGLSQCQASAQMAALKGESPFPLRKAEQLQGLVRGDLAVPTTPSPTPLVWGSQPHGLQAAPSPATEPGLNCIGDRGGKRVGGRTVRWCHLLLSSVQGSAFPNPAAWDVAAVPVRKGGSGEEKKMNCDRTLRNCSVSV